MTFGPLPTRASATPGRLYARREPDLFAAVVRHRAGQFKGSRTPDGRVVKCAYDQLDLREEAYRIYGFKRKQRPQNRKVAVDGHSVKDQYKGKYATGSPTAAVFDSALNLRPSFQLS